VTEKLDRTPLCRACSYRGAGWRVGVSLQPAVLLSRGCAMAQAAVQRRIERTTLRISRAKTRLPKNANRTSQRLGEPACDPRRFKLE
jgi:hypothetical protein